MPTDGINPSSFDGNQDLALSRWTERHVLLTNTDIEDQAVQVNKVEL